MRTDMKVQALPKTYPNVGGLYGKNITVTDDFGATITRLTDGSCGNPGGFNSLTTVEGPSAYDMWNTDDTLLAVLDTNGAVFFYQWTPATKQGLQLGTSAPYKINGSYCFSKTNPGVCYNVPNGSSVLSSINFSLTSSGGMSQWTYSGTTPIYDFAKLLPAGFNVNWKSDLTTSMGDQMFGIAFSQGNQDTGFNSCLFSPKLGGRMLDSQLMLTSGDWGTIGKVTMKNSKLTKFLLHGFNTTPNPEYTLISAVTSTAGGNTLIWPNGGSVITGTGLGGHHGDGYLSTYQSTGTANYKQVQYATPAVNSVVIPNNLLPQHQVPPQIYKGDDTSAFMPISNTDESLLWISNGPPNVYPYAACWEGEIRGLDVSGKVSGTKGTMYRLCHTFNSGKSKEYVVTNAHIGVSQTNNYIAFSSDWAGGFKVGPLGSTSGAAVGTVGKNARGDVFIVSVPKQ
jgi:hypothetical protein